jgi:hypothetical protein
MTAGDDVSLEAARRAAENALSNTRAAEDALGTVRRAANVINMQRAAEELIAGSVNATYAESLRRGVDVVRAASQAHAIQSPGLIAIDQSIKESIAAWQGVLLDSRDISRAVNAVGKSVAEAFASRQTYMSETIQTLATVGLVLRPQIVETGRWLREMTAALDAPFKELAQQTRAAHLALVDALRPAARAAAAEWAERARLQNERQRATVAALQRDGWWVAPSWPMTRPSRLVALRKAQGKRALDREVCGIYRVNDCRALRAMVRSWDGEPAFKARRSIIREAFELHREGRYKSSIPTLLPHVEGIAVEVFAPGAGAKNPMKLYKDGVDPEQLDRMLGEALLFTLGILYQWIPFATVNPRARTWNRHVVLHGRSTNYASEANSLRVFLTLDQLASEIRAKRRHDAKTEVA